MHPRLPGQSAGAAIPPEPPCSRHAISRTSIALGIRGTNPSNRNQPITTLVSRPVKDCEDAPRLQGFAIWLWTIPAQVFRFTLQFRRPQQQGPLSGCSAQSRVRSSGGVPAELFLRAEWQALAECVARGGEHAPDTPKRKCALRFSSLADPMP